MTNTKKQKLCFDWCGLACAAGGTSSTAENYLVIYNMKKFSLTPKILSPSGTLQNSAKKLLEGTVKQPSGMTRCNQPHYPKFYSTYKKKLESTATGDFYLRTPLLIMLYGKITYKNYRFAVIHAPRPQGSNLDVLTMNSQYLKAYLKMCSKHNPQIVIGDFNCSPSTLDNLNKKSGRSLYVPIKANVSGTTYGKSEPCKLGSHHRDWIACNVKAKKYVKNISVFNHKKRALSDHVGLICELEGAQLYRGYKHHNL